MKILLTGGEGQLGTELIAQSSAFGFEILAPPMAEMDVTEPSCVNPFWDAFRPEVVINAAAYTAVDRAESEPELAISVNSAAPAFIARRCSQEGVPLVHISTDYVFDGKKGAPYLEDDPLAPLGVYGRSKADGESAVRSALARHLIIRTAWLYSAYGVNFVKTVMRLAMERDELRVVDDQIGSPTSARDLAAAILTIIGGIGVREPYPWGTYHYCGSGITSWWGLARRVLDLLVEAGRMNSFRLLPISTAEYPTPARRPAYSVLDCRRIEAVFGISRPAWKDSVARAVHQLLHAATSTR